MSLPADWTIRTYSSHSAPEGFRAVAHVFGPSTNTRTGKTRIVMLPATEFADEPWVAADRLRAFLEGQISKEAAKSERGRLLGARGRCS